jgi:glutathione-regulated potassium-efflux system ancillary protein KefG
MSETKKILILFAHPVLHKSRINSKILRAIEPIQGITVRHLYELYSDFHIDVKQEQELLLEHDIIVWQHPFYWYSAPAIIKEWIDLVLEHGFAYGREGVALKGKAIFNAITTGGTLEAYSEQGRNTHTINQFLAPYKQTARLCNMTYLPPFVIHGTHLLNDDKIKDFVDEYKSILIGLRDGIFDTNRLDKLTYLNDILTLKQ